MKEKLFYFSPFLSLLIIFLSFFSSIFDFLAVFLSFVQSQSRFFFHCFFFIKSSFSLYHVFLIRYSFLSSFISLNWLVLINAFSHCLCKLFSFIHFKYCSVVISFSFPFYLYLFCVFHFSKLLFRFFFIP